jgi:uncharacterized protein YoxC
MILAVAWAVLVIFLCLAVYNTSVVLASTKALIDGITQETVPLLSEVTTTVTSVNKELNRVDSIVESVGNIVKSAEHVSKIIEQAVSSPLIKVAAYGAGLTRAAKRFGKKRQ